MSVNMGDTFIDTEGHIWEVYSVYNSFNAIIFRREPGKSELHIGYSEYVNNGLPVDWQQCWRDVEPAVGQIWRQVGVDERGKIGPISHTLIKDMFYSPTSRSYLRLMEAWVCLTPPTSNMTENTPEPAKSVKYDVCKWAEPEVIHTQEVYRNVDTEGVINQVGTIIRKKLSLRREWPRCHVTDTPIDGFKVNFGKFAPNNQVTVWGSIYCPHCQEVKNET